VKPFDYVAATSVQEAVTLLAGAGGRARPLAGGTDILVHLREGRYEVDLLVDVKRIPQLNELTFDPVAGLTIGAAVPCCRIYEDPLVRRRYSALADSASMIGGTAIQGRATLGGNLCNTAPSADGVPSMVVLGGVCQIAGPHGARSVPVEHFSLAPGQCVLEDGELLVSLHFPAPAPHSGSCHLRFTPRHEMDIAVAGCSAAVTLSDDGATFVSAYLALATVAPTVLLVEEAGAALAGQPVSEERIAAAARLAQAAARPRTSTRGTAAQRRHLVGVLTQRTLWEAIRRARGEANDGR
jgi:CO/xanthine dehydrogenase FAD-binding subunit